MINLAEIDWFQLLGLTLGGIGTALGIYNAVIAHQAMKPKLRISWLNCQQEHFTFSELDVDKARERVKQWYPRFTGLLEGLPEWIGALRERFVQADITFHNTGGTDLVICNIEIDDWIRGQGPSGSVGDTVMARRFQAIDASSGEKVDLSSLVTLAPHRSITRRILIREEHPGGPGRVDKRSRPVPPPRSYLLLRVVTDAQPPLVVKRIPLKPADRPLRPEWRKAQHSS